VNVSVEVMSAQCAIACSKAGLEFSGAAPIAAVGGDQHARPGAVLVVVLDELGSVMIGMVGPRPRWPISIKLARSSWRVADVGYLAPPGGNLRNPRLRDRSLCSRKPITQARSGRGCRYHARNCRCPVNSGFESESRS
jgi:hypothetical protein